MTLVVDAHMHTVPGADWFPAAFGGAEEHWWREVRWRGEKTSPEYFEAALAEMPDPDCSKVLARMDAAGIDVAVTMPMDHGVNFGDEGMVPIAEQNRISCGYAAATGGRVLSFCGVDPRRPEAAELLRTAVDEWGARGLKLYPTNGFAPDDPVCHPLYDIVAERGLPVLLHGGHSSRRQKSKYGHPMLVDAAAADYPEVDFIIGHSGRWEGWSREAFAVAVYKTNVVLDMSLWQHWASPDQICRALLWLKDRVGLDRVLFASDMIGIEVSWTLPEWADQVRGFGELAKQLGGDISAAELDLVMGGNAVRLMGIEAPAGNRVLVGTSEHNTEGLK
ncbi:MAG: amidohydrolase [Actinobacteria bacterium]|nr:amidohydrolase [Actinomycetota bacterium]